MKPKWPLPQPQPATPLRGDVVEITFETYVIARLICNGLACNLNIPEQVLKLYRKFGAYGVKPKRNSAGIVWNNRAFWWSSKGFYRCGRGGDRRPLQHLVWEKANRRKMPPKHEIYFRDRDRHNFEPKNLLMLHKAKLHKLLQDTEEINSNPWHNKAKDQFAAMLGRFNNKDKNAHSQILKSLGDLRREYHPQAVR